MARNPITEYATARQGVKRAWKTDKGFQPRYAEVEAKTAARRFQAEADWARQLAPQVAELNAMSPQIGLADANFTRELEAAGPSEIENELNRQALAGLKLGGSLSHEQVRDSAQGARAAFAARGLENSTPAAAAEILQRDAYSRSLEADRRNFAFAADGLSNNRQQVDRSFALTAQQAARDITDVRAEIFGRGGSQVSGVTSGTRFTDMLPFVNSLYSDNEATHRQNLANSAAVNLAQMSFGHDRKQLDTQLGFNANQAALNRELSREEFAANQSASERNAAANREAAKDSQTASYISTGVTAAVGLVLF